jgi:hypothetical protein
MGTDAYLRAGRVLGASLTGAAVGAAVAGIWHAGLEAASNACRGTNGFCIGIRPGAEAIFGNALVIAAGVCLGFGVLRIRPLRLTIPVGCILVVTLTSVIEAGIPGGNAPPVWAAAVAAGAGLAALALSVDWGRPQIVGMIALPVVVVAACVLPHVISPSKQASTREQEFATLGVPLLLPDVPGYYASGAGDVSGTLSVTMTSDNENNTVQPAFTVSITPVVSSVADTTPSRCVVEPHDCQVLRPGVWLVSIGLNRQVVTWRGNLEVDAFALGYTPVTTESLAQAATDLRPTTANALASLGP